MTLSELINILQKYPNPEQEFSIVCMIEDSCLELEYVKVISVDKGADAEIVVAIMANPIGLGTIKKLKREDLH